MGSILTKVNDDQLPEEVLYICNIVHTIPCIDLEKVYVHNWRDMETVEGNAEWIAQWRDVQLTGGN